MSVEITLKTDNKPKETSWLLKRRSAPHSIDSKPSGFYTESFQQHYYRYCVPDHQLYEFRISDSGGDGIQGDHGHGFYELKVNGIVEDEGGDFNRFAIDYFEGTCEGVYSSFELRLFTGTNPHFVSWQISSDSNYEGLPMSGGPWTNPFFRGMNMEYNLQECFPTASCYTLTVKSNPDGYYQSSTGASARVNFGGTNVGYDLFTDWDERVYNFGANCGLSSNRRLRNDSSSTPAVVIADGTELEKWLNDQ